MNDRELRPAGRYEWEQIIRRARLGTVITGSGRIGKTGRPTRGGMSGNKVTGIALCWASYADDQGRNIWAGDATVAVDMETTIKDVREVRKALLRLGLLQLVRGRRGDRGDEYRLTLSSDLQDLVDLPDPAQHKLAAQRLRDAARGKPAGSTEPPQPPTPGGPPDHPDADPLGGPPDPHTTNSGSPPDHPDGAGTETSGWSTGPAENGSGWSTGPALGGPPDPLTDHDRPISTTDHSDIALRTTVTPTRATPPPKAEKRSPPLGTAAARCPDHNLAAGTRPDGQPRCPLCRALDRISAPNPPHLHLVQGGAA